MLTVKQALIVTVLLAILLVVLFWEKYYLYCIPVGFIIYVLTAYARFKLYAKNYYKGEYE